MHSEDVGFDVAVPGEELEANTAGMLVAYVHLIQLVVGEMLLIVMSLQHDLAFDGLVTTRTGVGCADVLVVWCARQVVHTFSLGAAGGQGEDGGWRGAVTQWRVVV